MELKDTIEMMTSEDYKERFKAEYCQLGIRYNKLKNAIKNSKLNKENCNVIFLVEQMSYMHAYLDVLLERAKLEKVELPDRETL
jgi:hypothetical protein